MTSSGSVSDSNAQDDSKAGAESDAGVTIPDEGVSEDDGDDKARCWLGRACHSCSQHLCLVTAVSLCSAITVLIIINIVFGFDPFLIILMFSLIFLLMTLLTG